MQLLFSARSFTSGSNGPAGRETDRGRIRAWAVSERQQSARVIIGK
jgi:hypothetical protein